MECIECGCVDYMHKAGYRCAKGPPFMFRATSAQDEFYAGTHYCASCGQPAGKPCDADCDNVREVHDTERPPAMLKCYWCNGDKELDVYHGIPSCRQCAERAAGKRGK